MSTKRVSEIVHLGPRTARVAEAVSRIDAILCGLDPDDRLVVQRALIDRIAEVSIRGNRSLRLAVIQLFEHSPSWRVDEVKAAVASFGVRPKTIYNLLGDLSRRGLIRKAGYGIYRAHKIKASPL